MELLAFAIIWTFWSVIIGLLAKRKNLNAFAWGIAGGLWWPVGLIALAFQKYRCGSCGMKLERKPGPAKLCVGCGEPEPVNG